MPHVRNRLTARSVQAADAPGLYADGGGLNLQIAKGGSKSWIYRFTLRGRARQMGLGSVFDVTLAQARDAADDARRMVRQGVDPIDQRETDRASVMAAPPPKPTFSECCERFLSSHERSWKNAKHRQQWRNTLETYAAPVFGHLPVDTVDTGLVMQALEPIWAQKSETASRLRGRIESVLDWARVRGYRAGENPARWRGHLDALLPSKDKIQTVKHHAALHYAKTPAFVTALASRSGIAARGLHFLILTAARPGEAAGCRWDEIDLDASVWTVPAARMKAKKAHRVPLSNAAIEILNAMRSIQQSDFVFPGQAGNRSLWTDSFRRVLKTMGYDSLTTHGFRSTFRDWAAEQTDYPREVAEMALAHSVSNKVEAAYRRGDLFEKRRALMDGWSNYIQNQKT